MRNVITGILLLMSIAASTAQTVIKPQWKEVVGTWRGYYTDNGQERSMTLTFDSKEGICTIDMPDRGVTSAICKIMICEAGDLHITKSGVGQSFTFVGKPEGNTMKGQYKTGNSCSPGEMMEFKIERIKI